MSRRLMAVALAGLALAGCARIQPRPSERPVLQGAAAAAAEAAQRRRADILRARPAWSFAGRVAIQKAGKGGSGRIDWQQAGTASTVSLSAPVTRQSWRLQVDAQGARLDGLEGGPRQGLDAERLLAEATGWDIPVQALADWVLGLEAPAAGPAQVEFSAEALPARIVQGGWQIAYPAWRTDAATGQALPAQVEARREDAIVRLIIDQWQWDVAEATTP